ncbi:MAG TPA: hypothetical protein VE130_14710 [Nitrososphaeraceae archaeon]|jgi:hypothetical protein|nr:hypothetical protein [Nitrososphaeraceae archaeon]
MSVIVMIAFYQSGTLNLVSALSVKDLKEHLHGIDEDQLSRAIESLKPRGIDEDQLLHALKSLDADQAGMIEVPNQAEYWYVVAIFAILAIGGLICAGEHPGNGGQIIEDICDALTRQDLA